MSDTQQLIKNFQKMILSRVEVKSERDAKLVEVAQKIAPDVIPMICGSLTIPWTSMQAPVGMLGGEARCAQARKLRTRFELARLLDEQYYPELAAKLAAELSEMDREVAFYIIVMPMGILGDKICLATRYAEIPWASSQSQAKDLVRVLMPLRSSKLPQVIHVGLVIRNSHDNDVVDILIAGEPWSISYDYLMSMHEVIVIEKTFEYVKRSFK